MTIIDTIILAELRPTADRIYGTMVKADVDVAKKIVVIDMDMHADGEAYLLERGSQQADLWGINLHPDKFGTDDFIEFDSMINIRPRHSNSSRDVLDHAIRPQIIDIIAGVVR